MPIDSTRPSSEYTSYVRERADIIKRGTLDFSSSLFRSAVFTSAFARPEPPVEDYGILTGFGDSYYLLYRDLNPGSSDFTVECFFKADDIDYQVIWAFDRTGPWIGLNIYSGDLRLIGYTGGESIIGFIGTIEYGVEYYCAISRSGNNWYGTLNTTTTLLTNTSFNLEGLDLSIGGDYDDERLESAFSGQISNFRYVKRALYTAEETTTIPNRPLQNISDTELLLLAKQDAPFADSSDAMRTAEGMLPRWTAGTSDYGILEFSVIIGQLYYPNFGITGDFTVELFFKTSSGSGQAIWDYDSPNRIGMDTDGGHLNIRRTGGNLNDLAPLQLNKWYHAAVTREGNNWYSSVNGVTTFQDSVELDLSVGDLAIGTDSPDGDPFYDGSISNFRVSNYARYTTNFRVPTPPLSSQGARLLLLAKQSNPFGDSAGTNVSVNSCSWAPGPIQLGSS
jgi:hypothetical protein